MEPNGSTPEGEVYGILFGQRIAKGGSNIYKVTVAVANQIVLERTGDGVSVSNVHIDRIREVTELFLTYNLLGIFHSHPFTKDEFYKTNSVEPFGTVLENAVDFTEGEYDNMFDHIIGITRLEHRSTVEPNSPKSNMIHACCGNYKYTLFCNIALAPKEDRGRFGVLRIAMKDTR